MDFGAWAGISRLSNPFHLGSLNKCYHRTFHAISQVRGSECQCLITEEESAALGYVQTAVSPVPGPTALWGPHSVAAHGIRHHVGEKEDKFSSVFLAVINGSVSNSCSGLPCVWGLEECSELQNGSGVVGSYPWQRNQTEHKIWEVMVSREIQLL